VNDELERIWKRRSWPNLRYDPSIFFLGTEETQENSVRIAGLRNEILTSFFEFHKSLLIRPEVIWGHTDNGNTDRKNYDIISLAFLFKKFA
jgi:hypothetical protein